MTGHRLLRERILHSLKKGEKLQISNTPDTAKECAAALRLYLTQMKTPVMPKRVQELLLGKQCHPRFAKNFLSIRRMYRRFVFALLSSALISIIFQPIRFVTSNSYFFNVFSIA
jgi:hypothetical protein